MRVMMFQRRFVQLIRKGVKTTTMRRPWQNGDFYRVGEELSLRYWAGLPYRSKQRRIYDAIVGLVVPVLVSKRGVYRSDERRWLDRDHIACDEGFGSWDEMREWFAQNHGLPVRLRLIYLLEPGRPF